jgi:hypothetical protein
MLTPGTIFSIANTTALAAWLLLALWPRHHRTPQIVAGAAVPALFAAAYAVILAAAWRGSAGGFSTLADVALLFGNPWLLLAGWIHYLAFDLLVGCWEVRDARARGIPQAFVVPCLALTFMFGPAGWLAYVVLRSAGSRWAGAGWSG